MLEKMESKIEVLIDSILAKDNLNYCDYQILVNEIGRQEAKKKAEKWAADQDKRNAALMETMKGLWDSSIG